MNYLKISMIYNELVKVYLNLERTTKKLEKTDILTEFLKNVNKNEIKDIIHLLQGKVFPEYDERKIGMSSRLILKVISISTGINQEKVEMLWKDMGDLGKTAEELIKKRQQLTLAREELSIKKVVQNITKLAEFQGEGTVDKKIKLISELLNSAEPGEARFIVSTILEELRIGTAEGIIRDALAKVFSINADDVEKAYNITTDYGEVAEILKEYGIKGLEKVSIKPGIPIKSMLSVLTSSIEEAFESLGKPAQFENKIDGFRIQCHKINERTFKIFTRNLEDVTIQFPDIVKYIKNNVKAREFILDAEAVAYDKKNKKHLPFQNISQRIKRKYDIQELADKFPVQVNIFDLIYYNHTNLMNVPLKERREILERIVNEKKDEIVLTNKTITDDEKKAEKFFNETLKQGDEGIMIKNLDSYYIPGRYVNGWAKLKNILEPLDLVIVKSEYGNGKRSKWITSYTMACKNKEDLLEIGKVSTGVKEKTEGLTYEEMTKLLKPLILHEKGKEIIVKPKIILEIAYEEIQKSPTSSSGYSLRFPRILRIRNKEKTLNEINTIKDVEKIYNSQRGKK